MDTIISSSERETVEAGAALGRMLRIGDVVALCGDLGAGKTQFVKGLVRAIGAQEEAVTSPTFTLIHEYPGGEFPVFHADLYRLKTAEEAFEIGLEDYFDGEGVTAVEWADKFPELIPEGARWIYLGLRDENLREIVEIRNT